MNRDVKRRGHYLGTDVDEKWWKRYTKDGLLARGIGEFQADATGMYFRRHFTNTPVFIPWADVVCAKTGKWHSGRWAGGATVVKIIWIKGNT